MKRRIVVTQRERARTLIAQLAQDLEGIEKLRAELQDVVERAQNAPEYGGFADGSLDDRSWDFACDVQRDLNTAIRAVARAHSHLKAGT